MVSKNNHAIQIDTQADASENITNQLNIKIISNIYFSLRTCLSRKVSVKNSRM